VLAGPSAVLEIPTRLLPPSNLEVIDQYFLSTKKEDFDTVPRIQGDIDRFFEDTPVGTYRLGFWGHGINSYALYLQSRSAHTTVFLRMPFGGHFGDNVEQLTTANSYLEDLATMLEECEARRVEIKVCESMGVGFYRLFTPMGQGVEFEESLFDRPDRTTRFKKMMATFVVEISRGKEMKMFFNDDHGYRSWLNENPDGFVLNARKKPTQESLYIHASKCPSISDDLENYTNGIYQKICAPQLDRLHDWAREADGRDPVHHKACLG